MSEGKQRINGTPLRALPVTEAALSESSSRDRLLKRAQVADMLAVSESTVRRLEKTVLRPVIIDRVCYQREQDVREYMRSSRASAGDTDATDGATASAAFEVFESGLGPADVVRRLKITPQAARVLHGEWADLRGGFVVGGRAAKKLERIRWLNATPVTSGDDLVAILIANAPELCPICKKSSPQYCGRCAVTKRSAVEAVVEQQCVVRERRRESLEERSLSRATAETAREAVEAATARGQT